MTSLICEVPLEPEVALMTRSGVRGDDRYEERALVDLLADLLIPRVTAPQFALVKPDLDAGGAQGITDLPRSLGILRGIAQEHRSGRCARRLRRLLPHPRPLDLLRTNGECLEKALAGNFGRWTDTPLTGPSAREALPSRV